MKITTPTFKSKCDRTQGVYVIFSDNVYVRFAYAILPYTLTVRWPHSMTKINYV